MPMPMPMLTLWLECTFSNHTIALTATDSDGMTGADMITVAQSRAWGRVMSETNLDASILSSC
ncbi:MAG: hypothetical protein AAFV53_24125 [Myxococcota bacterium]